MNFMSFAGCYNKRMVAKKRNKEGSKFQLRVLVRFQDIYIVA